MKIILKGEDMGHPFRGNQYTNEGGTAGGPPVLPKNMQMRGDWQEHIMAPAIASGFGWDSNTRYHEIDEYVPGLGSRLGAKIYPTPVNAKNPGKPK